MLSLRRLAEPKHTFSDFKIGSYIVLDLALDYYHVYFVVNIEMKLELLRNQCYAPEYKEECGFLVSIQRSDPFTVANLLDYFLSLTWVYF